MMTMEEKFKNAYNGYINADVHIDKNLRLIGIEAIAKQIPEKPVVSDGNYKCVSCRKLVHPTSKFCQSCGQRVDWK